MSLKSQDSDFFLDAKINSSPCLRVAPTFSHMHECGPAEQTLHLTEALLWSQQSQFPESPELLPPGLAYLHLSVQGPPPPGSHDS